MSNVVVGLRECPNCGTSLGGSYCATCGQKVSPINPSFHDLTHDLVHEFLHVDGTIFQSIRLLLTRPGVLTRDQFIGRRARHVSPIRLYLIFSVVFFGVSALAVANRPIFSADEAVEMGAVGEMLGLTQLSPAEANELISHAQTTWLPRVMFVLVPLCAVLVQAVTRRSGKNYPQHLYFALHGHAAYFAALSVTGLIGLLPFPTLRIVLGLSETVFLIGYTLIAFHTAYGGRWWLAAGRTAFVLVTYSMAVSFALMVMMFAVLDAIAAGGAGWPVQASPASAA